MRSEQLDLYQPNAGFWATDSSAIPPNALVEGSENIFCLGVPGAMRVFKGLSQLGQGARSLFSVVEGWAGLTDEVESESESESEGEVQVVAGYGSIFNFISRSLFFIGSGYVYYNGTLLQDGSDPFVATSNLQLSPYPYTEVFVAGLATPDAPQVEARTPSIAEPFTGLLTGLYSFKIARVRSLTGAASNASSTSAVLTFSGQTVRITFPEADTNGQDRWAVFATKSGFGGTGVHYLVQEVDEADLTTIDGIARSFQLEFNDSDLLPVTAYIDNFPPPAGSFGGRLENYVVVVGAYNNAIAISIRNFPESYHPEHLAFLPKRPTSVLQDQMGSYMYVSTESSVHAISVAPSAFGNPLIMQTVWNDTGVEHNHNWCLYEGAIFAYVKRQGAVTMDSTGRPSGQFALPVSKAMKNWEVEDTIVLPCPDLGGVLYCNGGDAYLFNVENLQWSSPAKVNDFAIGDIVSGVVVDRRLKMCLLDGEDFTLYDFDELDSEPDSEAEEGTAFKIVAPDRAALNPGARFNVLGIKGIFHASEARSYTLKAVTDYTGTEKTLTHAAPTAGMQTTVQSRWYLPRCEAVRVEFAGTQTDFTEDMYLAGISVFGTPEDSNRLT